MISYKLMQPITIAQAVGHKKNETLKPDLSDILNSMAQKGHKPIFFLPYEGRLSVIFEREIIIEKTIVETGTPEKTESETETELPFKNS